ncbi:unnamed protein product, partial [Mesorhabditis spiculigera]
MTVNRSEYNATPGERYDVVGPKESDLLRETATSKVRPRIRSDFQAGTDIWNKEGGVEQMTVNRSEYSQGRRTLRCRRRRNIWNKEGGVEQMTVNRSEYSARPGERYDVVAEGVRPRIRSDFQAGRGDRYDAVKPGASDIWNKEGGVEQMTVNRSEYSAKAGERYDVVKPKESDLLRGDGHFE